MRNWLVSNPVFESDLLNNGLPVSPWAGHRNFAYDLVNFTRPKTIIELGTHYGCSFFSFCQAVKDNRIDTRLLAVDTWKGDPQAGFYEETVYDLVNQTKDNFYGHLQINLIRKTFLEALPEVADETADLIHIDGFHTYEAVKEDFETWLPKLRENGIILFHDTAPDTGYGSRDFWEEIRAQYPYYEFEHSWGLGVLFPKGDYWYNKMMEQNIKDKIDLYYYKSEYQLSMIKVNDLEKMATERFEAMGKMEGMIKERDQTIEGQQALIEERYAKMLEMEHMIRERDAVIEGQQQLVEERYSAMQDMEDMINKRDITIKAQQQLVEERYTAMQEMEQMIKERDEVIKAQQQLVEERYTAMRVLEQIIKERDEMINVQQQLVEERYTAMQEMEHMIKERDEVIKAQQQLVEERYRAMQEMEHMIKERDEVIKVQQQLGRTK